LGCGGGEEGEEGKEKRKLDRVVEWLEKGVLAG